MNFYKFLRILFLSIVISISFNYSVFAAKLTVPDNLIGKRTLYLVPGSEPAAAEEGQIYFNATDSQLYYCYDDTNWTVLSGGGGDKVVATRVVAAYNSVTPDGPSSCLGDGSACDNLKADFTCDGTDDQLKIQDAINALGDNPGAVYLLEGTYNISAPITLDTTSPVDSGKAIIGSGASTVLKAAANVNVINAANVNGILISQLRIDGNNGTGSNGIYFNAVTNSKIIQVWIEQMSQNGIYLYSASNNNVISGNNIQSNRYNGIYLYSSSNNNTISGNNIQSNGSSGYHGIYLQSSSGNTISSNNIQGLTAGSQQNGIYLYSSSNNNTISGNNIQSNRYNGIYLYSSSNSNTVSGNNSQLNSRNGIYLNSSNNNSISGNSFQANGYRGIYIYTSSSNNAVTANAIYDNGSSGAYDGIRIETDSDSNLISSNLLYDSAGTGRPINVASSTCDNTYLTANLISSWPASYKEINDSGTTTRYTQKEKVTLERQAPVAPANGSTLDVTTSPKGYLPLLPTAAVTLNATVAIAGNETVAVGNLLILEGRSDTNTVTIEDNANVQLASTTDSNGNGTNDRVLGLEDTLKLLWNGADWLEMAYANN